MGLFFERIERKKSSKPVFSIKILLIIAMVLCLVIGIMNEFDSVYINLSFLLASIIFLIDGVESYIRKEDKKVYRTEFPIGSVYFILTLLFWI